MTADLCTHDYQEISDKHYPKFSSTSQNTCGKRGALLLAANLLWTGTSKKQNKKWCGHVSLLFTSKFSRSVMSDSVTPWTAACQASLSITNSRSLLKLMSIKSFHHLILCHPLLLPSIFPASGSFLMSQFFESGGQSVGASASVSVLPMNIQGWFASGFTNWIILLYK